MDSNRGCLYRLRDIAVSPEGNVYISTDNGEHKDMIIEVIKR
ncbi:MAG: hypothetical protein ABIN67_20830 [Ferruginibacter sp.]